MLLPAVHEGCCGDGLENQRHCVSSWQYHCSTVSRCHIDWHSFREVGNGNRQYIPLKWQHINHYTAQKKKKSVNKYHKILKNLCWMLQELLTQQYSFTPHTIQLHTIQSSHSLPLLQFTSETEPSKNTKKSSKIFFYLWLDSALFQNPWWLPFGQGQSGSHLSTTVILCNEMWYPSSSTLHDSNQRTQCVLVTEKSGEFKIVVDLYVNSCIRIWEFTIQKRILYTMLFTVAEYVNTQNTQLPSRFTCKIH